MSKNYYKCLDGYYYRDHVYRDKPLDYCPNGQCGIVFCDDVAILKSYVTHVLEFNRKTGWLYCTGLYSRTTIKHIGYFLKEMCPGTSYYTIRDAYKNNMVYNVYTGELKTVDKYLTEGAA